MYHLELNLAQPSKMNVLTAQMAIGQRESTSGVEIIAAAPGIRIERGPLHADSGNMIDRLEISPKFATVSLELSVPISHEPDYAALMVSEFSCLPVDLIIVYGPMRIRADVSIAFPRSRLDPKVQWRD